MTKKLAAAISLPVFLCLALSSEAEAATFYGNVTKGYQTFEKKGGSYA